MEIIVLPYMAVSFAIVWAVFSPLAKLENLDDWTFARLETSDLLAVFLPLGYLLTIANWTTSFSKLSEWVVASIAAAILMFVLFGLLVGLFILAKMNRPPAIKRMAMIGIVVPLGSLLSIAWIVLPIWACASSIVYAIPATLAIIPATLALRGLSYWVCNSDVAPK